MRAGTKLILLSILAIGRPAIAHGQAERETLAERQVTSAPVTRMDISASIGAFTADRGLDRDVCCGWTGSFFKGIGAGYYWTDHLKSEIEIGWPGENEAYRYLPGESSGRTFTVTTEEHTFTSTKFSAGQLYQFGRNAMFHSFVGAGVEFDRERDEIERRIQTERGALPPTQVTETALRTRPYLTSGFKAYFSERTFFRGEVKLAIRDQIDQVSWKSGFGVDIGSRTPRRATATGCTQGAHGAPARERSGAQGSPRATEPGCGAEPHVRGQDPPELWRRYASKLTPGSRVQVSTASEDRFDATLLASDDTGILVKPHTRVPEPPRHIDFTQLEWLAPASESGPGEHAGAVAVAVGTGGGVFLTLLLILLSQID
jgi:hypothetical protein